MDMSGIFSDLFDNIWGKFVPGSAKNPTVQKPNCMFITLPLSDYADFYNFHLDHHFQPILF